MVSNDITKELDSIYYNLKTSGSYSSQLRLYRAAREHGLKVSHKTVSEYLKSQPLYTTYRKAVYRGPTRPIRTAIYYSILEVRDPILSMHFKKLHFRQHDIEGKIGNNLTRGLPYCASYILECE